MCTLTLLRERWLTGTAGPHPLWRVVFNRDEQRSRPLARAPELHVCGTVRTLHPIDPQGGGTWIAATEQGLVLALLNGSDVAPAGVAEGSAIRSRGGIVPALAAMGARRAADVPVNDVDPRAYRPFHLVIADDREIVEVTSDGRALERAFPCADDRLMRTSSSLDAASVCGWRRRLFTEAATPASADDQDAFHTRSAPDRPACGVSMARADACTVSITTVEVFASAIRMAYRPLPGPDEVRVTDLVRAS
jgi:hypothetical protein